MILQALWPVTTQFQNKNGSILTSGRVYVYYKNRTTLAEIFSDEEGTVVNANPVLLDNNGRATVFADTIYSYTIVVCDYYGKELFSQDITLHDAISTAEDVIVMGSNGSVKVDTTTLPNGVQYDLSVNTDIIATKESVDEVNTDLNTLTGTVNNHTTQIEQIQEDINGIDSALANKKDKQNELNFNGSATKTVKSITQNANGELNVEYEDIDLPQEVPNVEITSKDGSVNVTESTDSQTNTKTFDLSVDSITNIASSDDSINVSTSEGVTDLTLPNDVVRDSNYVHIDGATEVPLMDGTAAEGISTKYAREDHVHPSDTSREAIANKTTVVLGTSDTKYPTDKAVADFVNSSISNSIDQTYSSTSTKAQSGVAVNEALKTRDTSTSDDSYTYLGMKKTYKGTEELYWKLVSFNTVGYYWTLQFEVDVSNGRRTNGSYDTEIYETKRLTICGTAPGIVTYASEMRYAAQGIDSNRGYGNNIYYDIDSSNLVTVYIKAIDRPNKTQVCRLKDFINFQGISNITWCEPVIDAGTQPTNPVKFKEFYPAIASTSSDIGSDSIPVYVRRGIPVTCDSSNLKAGKDDAGNVIKNTYQKKLTFDTTPTAGSTNPVTSDGIRTMKPISHRFDNENLSRLIVWGKANSKGFINDMVRKFGLKYGPITDLLFTNSVDMNNTTSVIIKILNDSSIATAATMRLKASIFKDSSENSYFALWLDGSISQPGWAYYVDYYPDVAEQDSTVSHFTVFNPSEYTLVRDLTIKYIPLAVPTPSAGLLTSNGTSNSWLTPPASGTAVLKSINGVIQWVTE